MLKINVLVKRWSNIVSENLVTYSSYESVGWPPLAARVPIMIDLAINMRGRPTTANPLREAVDEPEKRKPLVYAIQQKVNEKVSPV
jgi:hypothetical protein